MIWHLVLRPHWWCSYGQSVWLQAGTGMTSWHYQTRSIRTRAAQTNTKTETWHHKNWIHFDLKIWLTHHCLHYFGSWKLFHLILGVWFVFHTSRALLGGVASCTSAPWGFLLRLQLLLTNGKALDTLQLALKSTSRGNKKVRSVKKNLHFSPSPWIDL